MDSQTVIPQESIMDWFETVVRTGGYLARKRIVDYRHNGPAQPAEGTGSK